MWVGLIGAVLASTPPARADLARVRLAVVHTPGTEGCVADAEVRADVNARLGRDPFEANALRSIDVVLSRDATALIARIYTRDDPAGPAASRVLTSGPDDCPRLRASVNLAVALAIDPDAPLAPTPPSPSPAPVVTPRVSSPAPTPAPRPDPQAWDRSERLALRGAIVWGPVPGLAPAVALGFETGRRGWLRGSFGALRTFEELSSDSPGTFGFALTAFWAALCAGTADARWSVSACFGAQAGFTSGVVHTLVAGLVPATPGDYGWLALIAPIRGALRIVDPVVIELSVEPYVAVLRQSFRVQLPPPDDGVRTVWEQSPVGFFAYAGLRLRFW